MEWLNTAINHIYTPWSDNLQIRKVAARIWKASRGLPARGESPACHRDKAVTSQLKIKLPRYRIHYNTLRYEHDFSTSSEKEKIWNWNVERQECVWVGCSAIGKNVRFRLILLAQDSLLGSLVNKEMDSPHRKRQGLLVQQSQLQSSDSKPRSQLTF